MLRIRLLLIAALVLPTFFSGCAVNPVTGRNELALFQVSEQQEVELGQKAFPTAQQQMGGVYPDAALNDYVNRVGLRLARQGSRSSLPFQFKVVNDSTPNAFALPGGFIAITRGLLVNLDNESQLASVLGHEVAHVDARHSVQGMQRGALYDLGLIVLTGATGSSSLGPLARQAGGLAAGLLDRSYSRDQERESDRLGIDYMVRAGYNPNGAIELQEFFYRKLEGGAEPDWVGGLFRSHPFSRERLDANREYIRSRYSSAAAAPGALVGRRELQQATARLRETRAAYDLYDEARRLEREDKLAAAVPVYLQAAAAAPDEALILSGLGMAYLQSDDLGAARIHLSRAVQLDGRYYFSRLGLGYVYLQQKQADRAVAELETSMVLLPSLQGGYLLAEAYEKSGQKEKALEQYHAVAAADPNGRLGRSAAERARLLEGK
ncbi:M48 family metalloprotease [Trichloromonas sp.]|uniref:M48 family metalloprotease n=1 Tax=Trichloromonas sp. TaxID=3069249 RepID=UPI003D819115